MESIFSPQPPALLAATLSAGPLSCVPFSQRWPVLFSFYNILPLKPLRMVDYLFPFCPCHELDSSPQVFFLFSSSKQIASLTDVLEVFFRLFPRAPPFLSVFLESFPLSFRNLFSLNGTSFPSPQRPPETLSPTQTFLLDAFFRHSSLCSL